MASGFSTTTSQVAVTDTAGGTSVVTEHAFRKTVDITNQWSNEVYIFVGGGTVTTSNGLKIEAGGSYTTPVNVVASDPITAICDSTETTTLGVIQYGL